MVTLDRIRSLVFTNALPISSPFGHSALFEALDMAFTMMAVFLGPFGGVVSSCFGRLGQFVADAQCES